MLYKKSYILAAFAIILLLYYYTTCYIDPNNQYGEIW